MYILYMCTIYFCWSTATAEQICCKIHWAHKHACTYIHVCISACIHTYTVHAYDTGNTYMYYLDGTRK